MTARCSPVNGALAPRDKMTKDIPTQQTSSVPRSRYATYGKP